MLTKESNFKVWRSYYAGLQYEQSWPLNIFDKHLHKLVLAKQNQKTEDDGQETTATYLIDEFNFASPELKLLACAIVKS